MSGRTLRCNILTVGDVMKNTLQQELPSRFSIVFDGWSEGTQHYIDVAASYIKKVDDTKVSVQTMLSMRPLLAVGVKGMQAVDHIDHLTRVLESYGKNNVVCLVGDSCAVNQSMARIMKVSLLGCASHKFNLAVSRWIAEQGELTPIIAKVSIFVVLVAFLFIVSCANVIVFFPQVTKLMKKASTMKIACELRELTSYATVRENDTRWSSTYNMVTRFLKIQKELSEIGGLLSLLPNHLQVNVLQRGHDHMKKFDSEIIMLQRDGMTFVESRELFDLFLKDYPAFEHYILSEASVVENSAFESASKAIANGSQLTDELCLSAIPLLKPLTSDGASVFDDKDVDFDDNDDNDGRGEDSYAIQLERKRQRRADKGEEPGMYINLDMLPGTSVNCERLFSAAKFILSDTRKRTSTSLFEALLLLKMNSQHWNVLSVGEAMGRTKRMECATANSTIDVDDDDIDEHDVCGNGDPDLESVAHSRASSSLSLRTPY